MDNKKEFENLKIALLMIQSNISSLKEQIINYYPTLNLNPHPVQLGSSTSSRSFFTEYTSTYNYEIIIPNDFLDNVKITGQFDSIIITYIDTYIISPTYISTGKHNIKIDDIDTNDELFTLSTVRDFLDLNYETIMGCKYILNLFKQTYYEKCQIGK